MALRDIIVHLDTAPRSQVRLDFACAIAARHGSHVVGIYPMDIPSFAATQGDEMAHLRVRSEALLESLRETATSGADLIRTRFEETTRRHDVTAEWRVVEGQDSSVMALHARYADLAIIGQPDPTVPSDAQHHVTVTTMLTSGRPVISIPYAGTFTGPFNNALVAWNASREAARAVNDALPLLAACRKVTVLAINPRLGIGGHGDVPAADICLHLARHGINAEAAHTVADGISEGTALLNHAADLPADLIVMGAYGHSRLREWAFGGVTRTLLQTMTAPVFMSS